MPNTNAHDCLQHPKTYMFMFLMGIAEVTNHKPGILEQTSHGVSNKGSLLYSGQHSITKEVPSTLDDNL